MISNPYRFFLDERDQWSDDPFVSSYSIFDVWPLMIDVISVGYKTLIDLSFVMLHNHQIRCSGRFSLFAWRLLLSKAKSWLYPSQHLSPSQIGACGTFYSVGLFTFLMNLSLGCHNPSTSFFAYLPTTQKKEIGGAFLPSYPIFVVMTEILIIGLVVMFLLCPRSPPLMWKTSWLRPPLLNDALVCSAAPCTRSNHHPKVAEYWQPEK